MNGDQKYWVPDIESESLAEALSVPATSSELPSALFRDLFRQKLADLIEDDPREARYAMEMSQEYAPEFWTIANYHNRSDWAVQIVASDTLMPIMAKLPTKGSLSQAPEEPMSFRSVLELLLP